MTDTTAVATRQPDLSIQQFGSRDDVHALGKRIQALLPGGDKLTSDEAMAAAQYALAVGANPFRGETYTYKDKHGKLQQVEGYKLLVRWAKAKCEYSEWFEPMEEDKLPGQGDIGYTCYILRVDKHDLLQTLLKSQMPYETAMKIVTTTAGGVVRKRDQNDYPPSGWTWDDVAKKRALKNALNKSHGAPSLAEIARESWHVNGTQTQADDWADVQPGMTRNEAEATAAYNADLRSIADKHPENGDAAEAVGDLFGDEAAAEYVEGATVEDAEPHTGPSFGVKVLEAIVGAGHADGCPQAARHVGLSQVLTRNDDTQAVVLWAAIYATHRAVGLEPTPAAARADAEWKAEIDGARDGE